MTSKFFIAGIVVTGVAVTGVAVLASEGGHRRMERPTFSQIDADHSGEITLDELVAPVEDRLLSADANGDGLLTRDELLAQATANVERHVDRMMADLDANGDGQVSKDEFPGKRASAFFDEADKDGSGGLNEEEFADMRPPMPPRGHGHGHRHGHGDGDEDGDGDGHGPDMKRHSKP